MSGATLPPGPAVAIDLGARRIGIATTDRGRVLAHPERVLERSGDPGRDRAKLVAVVEELGAAVVVVGLPVALSGEIGIAARAALEEIDALRALIAVPVVAVDERLTTVEALRRVREATGARPGRRRRAPRVRPVVDDKAAAVLLQGWLDAGQLVP